MAGSADTKSTWETLGTSPLRLVGGGLVAVAVIAFIASLSPAERDAPKADPALQTIALAEIARAFDQNEVAASSQYAGAVQVTDTVRRVRVGVFGNPVIDLANGSAELVGDAEAVAAALKPRQPVELRCGQVSLSLGAVHLTDCALVG